MKSLITYEPGYRNLFDGFDRTFDSLFNTSLFGRARVPAVDIREEEDRYVLEAELTGLSEKDIDVKLDDNLLVISSKNEEDTESKQSGYILKERRSTTFSRSFVVPKDVDRKKIEARFKNGLLTLTLRKAPETKPKSIEVKVNA